MKLNTKSCLEWAEERGLLGEKPDTSKQFQKLASECMEFLDEINKGNLEKAYLEFGDVLVTMIIYCKQRGLDYELIYNSSEVKREPNGLDLIVLLGRCASEERLRSFSGAVQEYDFRQLFNILRAIAPQFDPQKALDLAVEKISNRKTFMINGTAVKEEDFTDNERKQLGNMS